MTKEQYILDLINQGYKDEDIAILVANKFPDELPLAAPAPTTNRTPQDVLDRLVAVIERVNNIHANNWTDTEFKNKALNVGLATEEYVDSESVILHSAITAEQKVITDAIKADVATAKDDIAIAKDVADKAIVKPTNLIAGKQYAYKSDGTFEEITKERFIEIKENEMDKFIFTENHIGKKVKITYFSNDGHPEFLSGIMTGGFTGWYEGVYSPGVSSTKVFKFNANTTKTLSIYWNQIRTTGATENNWKVLIVDYEIDSTGIKNITEEKRSIYKFEIEE